MGSVKEVHLSLPSAVTLQLTASVIPFDQLITSYLNGTKKEKLNLWWCDLIETQVEEFLKQEPGYDLHAVPFDYIDTPPASLQAIQKNLEIVRAILSPTLQSNNVTFARAQKSLITPLKTEIYSRLQHFKNHAELVVKNALLEGRTLTNNSDDNSNTNVYAIISDIGNSRVSVNQETVEALLQSIKQSRSQQQQRLPSFLLALEGVLADLDYIYQMEDLESHFDIYHADSTDNTTNSNNNNNNSNNNNNNGASRQLSDIVPISGLILGRFHRIENELKTVLDHWSYKLSQRQQQQHQPPHHRRAHPPTTGVPYRA